MEPKPTRRRTSKELPPEFSELMNKLFKVAASFIREFDNKEPRMREIITEFQKIVDEVKEIRERTDRQRREARETVEAPFQNIRSSWGFSLLAAPIAAADGTVLVISANVTKILSENGSVKKVEALGRDFTGIVEPLTKDLEEIKTTCEKLEQKSAELQAQYSLSDMEDFQRKVRSVSQLGNKGREVLEVVSGVLVRIGQMLALIVQVFRFTSNSEDDEKLKDVIVQSADKCQKVVDNFDQMKTELREFTESPQTGSP